MILIKGLAKALFLPPSLFVTIALGCVIGLLARRWLGRLRSRTRLGGMPSIEHGSGWMLSLSAISLVLALVAATPWFGGMLIAKLETSPPIDIRSMIEAPEAERPHAIVVLAGGMRRNAPERGELERERPNAVSIERAIHGVWLQRQLNLPMLVTGGKPTASRFAEAELMARFITEDMKGTVTWIESRSRTTDENARYTRAMLMKAFESKGLRPPYKVVLVSHAFHLPRARQAFEACGFEVIPAPTHYLSSQPQLADEGSDWADFIPLPLGFQTTYWAAHEWVGAWVYAATRKLRTWRGEPSCGRIESVPGEAAST